MAYHDDLLEQAFHLDRRDPKRPKQANLRRAVSSAYYAIFHLLVSDAVGYWKLNRQRSILARSFDHRKMRSACNGCASRIAELKAVAEAFVDLQLARHLADYDNSKTWTRTEADSLVERARGAFARWDVVRAGVEAQDFLLSLFTTDRR